MVKCNVPNETQGFCHPSNCRVTSNRTNCVTDHTPEMFDLRETVCERCVDERVKVRPVVEERTVCRDERAVLPAVPHNCNLGQFKANADYVGKIR